MNGQHILPTRSCLCACRSVISFGIITSGCDIEAESADFDAMVDEGEDVIDVGGTD